MRSIQDPYLVMVSDELYTNQVPIRLSDQFVLKKTKRKNLICIIAFCWHFSTVFITAFCFASLQNSCAIVFVTLLQMEYYNLSMTDANRIEKK